MAGRVICLAQQKGGAGKTTLAAMLAAALSGRGSVALIDSDPQGSLGMWARARAEEPVTGIACKSESAWGVSSAAKSLRRDHDFVIVDTPPKIDSDLRPALRAADLVLVPAAPSPLDLWATEDALELAGREAGSVLLVLNRVPARGRLSEALQEVVAQMDVRRAETPIRARVAYAEAMGSGLGVTEKARWKAAGAEIQALADEISGLFT